MKKNVLFLFLSLVFVTFVKSTIAQNTADLVIFSNSGEQFYVIINGVRQNNSPQTNVKVQGLTNEWYSCKIISANQAFEIDKSIGVIMGSEVTYQITGKKGKFKLKYLSETPFGGVQTVQGQDIVYYHTEEQPIGSTSQNNNTIQTQTNVNGQQNSTVNSQQNTSVNTNISTNQTGGQISTNTSGTSTTTTTTSHVNTSANSGGNNENVNLNININANETGANVSVSGNANTGGTNGSVGTSSTTTSTTIINGVEHYEETTTTVYQADDGTYYEETTTFVTSTNSTTGNSGANSTFNSNTQVNNNNTNQNNNNTMYQDNDMQVTMNNNCYTSVSDYENIKKAISNESFAEDKMREAKQATRGRCLSTTQIKELASLFSFSEDKMEFVKFCYANCSDRHNYYQLNEIFSFSEDKEELQNFIDNN